MWKQFSNDIQPNLTIPLSLKHTLRYGENPHQIGAFFVEESFRSSREGALENAIQHHGKEMSYNNFLVFLTTLK